MSELEKVNPELLALVEKAKQAQNRAKQTGKLNEKNLCEKEKEFEQKKFKIRILEAGIGKRFANCTFENIEKRGIPTQIHSEYKRVRHYADNLESAIEHGIGLLMRGPVGVMKTSLAIAILLKHIYSGGKGLFIPMASLLDTIFSLKAIDKEKWAKFEEDLRNLPLIVIDDLGAEYSGGEGWVKTKVDSIITERYNNMLPVIITTNLEIEDMQGTYAERITDRIGSTTSQIVFAGPTLRPRPGRKGA